MREKITDSVQQIIQIQDELVFCMRTDLDFRIEQNAYLDEMKRSARAMADINIEVLRKTSEALKREMQAAGVRVQDED